MEFSFSCHPRIRPISHEVTGMEFAPVPMTVPGQKIGLESAESRMDSRRQSL